MCVQRSDENIDSYVNELKTIAKTCEFGELAESLIRDRIVCGIRDDRVRVRLLREQDLDLQKAITICRASETTNETLKEMNFGNKSNDTSVHHVKLKNFKKQEKAQENPKKSLKPKKGNADKQKPCSRCGNTHGARCPAIGKICNNCGRKNHFKKKCFFRSSSNVHSIDEENISDSEKEFFVDSIDTGKQDSKYKLSVKTNGKLVLFKLDTGSDVNILSQKDFNRLRNKPKLQSTKAKLTSYSGDNIPVNGACILNLEHKDKCHKLLFIVAKDNVIPILGEKALDRSGHIKRAFTIENINCQSKKTETEREADGEKSTNAIVEQFKDVFIGLGCLKGEYKIEVDKSVKPLVTPCRKIPFKLHKKLKAELDRMGKQGVICTENEPTD